MPQRTNRALNSILKAQIEGRDFPSALKLYFLSLPFAHATTFSLLLRGFPKSGLPLHAHLLLTGSKPDLHLSTDLVSFYLRSGLPHHALKVFDQMPQRDLVIYTTMVDGLFKNGNHSEKAMEFFSQMRSSGIQPNSASWNAVISGLARHGRDSEALLHLRLMQTNKISPDQATLCIILPLLARSASALRSGAEVHGYAIRNNLSQDLFVATALLDMYAKNGFLSLACRIFQLSRERDAGLWNSMILALALHGYGDRALRLLREMGNSGAKPNQITFTAALSACNHSGMVDEGLRIFQSMVFDHGISPSGEHFSCLVDLLGRAGRLEEASLLASRLPGPPLEDVSGALLAACRTHSKVDFFVSGDGGRSSGKLVAISNMYAEVGKWEEVSRVRVLMRDGGLRKATACSWIEVEGKVHVFKVFDEMHPQKKQIYEALGYLEAVVSESEVGFLADLASAHLEMISGP